MVVTLRHPGRNEAEMRLAGLRLAHWRAREPIRLPAHRSTGQPSSPGLPADIAALSALLRSVRRAPVEALRLFARGGIGDAAATAVLYGASWSLVGTYLATTGLRPALLALQPEFDGPARVRVVASAAMRVRVFALVRGALAALWAMRIGLRRTGN